MTDKFSDYIVVFVLVFPLSCYYNSITLDRDVYNKQLAAAFSFVRLITENVPWKTVEVAFSRPWK